MGSASRVWECAYDPERGRLKEVNPVNGVLTKGWLYAGGLAPVAEVDALGQVTATFVYATKGNVPDYVLRDGTSYRLFTDHLGSVRLVVEAMTGALVQQIDYDAYGRILYDSNPGFQPFGFAGGLYDPQTGLTRFGARDYDPEVGRWTSKDPIGFAGGSAGLYTYVGNDPVNFADPSGLFEPSAQSYRACQSSVQTAANVTATGVLLSGVADSSLRHLAAFLSYGAVKGIGSLGCAATHSLVIDELSLEEQAGFGLQAASAATLFPRGMRFQAPPSSLPEVAAGDILPPAPGRSFLYQEVGATGEHLKFGITGNPATRYTAAQLAGGRLRIIAQGAREDMLALERSLHETLPIGPEEGQMFYVQKQVARGLAAPPYD